MKSFSNLHEINLTSTAMTFLIYRFAVLMKTPFKKWDAFNLGLIDEKGEVLRKAKTTQEKDKFGKLELFILKIRKIMLKYIRSEKLLTVLVYAYILKMESPNIAVLELEEELTLDERNELIEFIKGYYKENKNEII